MAATPPSDSTTRSTISNTAARASCTCDAICGHIFRRHYNDLGNRAITVHRLNLSAPKTRALRDHFASTRLLEDQELNKIREGERSLALLKDVSQGREIRWRIPAAGFFQADATFDAKPNARPNRAILALRRKVEAAHGVDLIAIRKAAIRQRVAHLFVSPESADRKWHFAKEYERAVSAMVALSILEQARELDPNTLVADEPPLTADERQLLVVVRNALELRLVDLFASQRSDRGFALLVGMARLAALNESLATNHLTVVNALPDDATAVDLDQREEILDTLQDRAEQRRRSARHAFFLSAAEAGFDERLLTALESALTRHAELNRAVATGTPVRVKAGLLIPSRSALWQQLPAPRGDHATSELEHAIKRLRDRVHRQRNYDLLSDNCATALIDHLSHVLAEFGVSRSALAFIPSRAVEALQRAGLVRSTQTLPSLHTRLIHQRRTEAHSLRVWLEESNTLTSSIYRRWHARGDSNFLFFTDKNRATRPILGAANLAYGTIATPPPVW